MRINKLPRPSLWPLGLTVLLLAGWGAERVATQQPVTITTGTAIIGKIAQVDSGGTAATDTTAHAVKTLSVDSTGTAVPVSTGGSGASDANTARVIQATDSRMIPGAGTTGGASNYSTLQTSGAVLTAQIKGSAGQAYQIDCTNTDTVATFVRLYDQTGAPASTDGANIVWRGTIPGSATGGGIVVPFPVGRVFATGIGIRISKAIADNDTTVLTANTVMCNVGYK